MQLWEFGQRGDHIFGNSLSRPSKQLNIIKKNERKESYNLYSVGAEPASPSHQSWQILKFPPNFSPLSFCWRQNIYCG